jgi:hypothetical protein
MSLSIAVKSARRCSANDARVRVSANSRRISSVSMRNCPKSPRVPFTRQDVIALNMLDLSLPILGAESVGGNDIVVSMHSIRYSINDSHVAPAMVTEVFTSARNKHRAGRTSGTKNDFGQWRSEPCELHQVTWPSLGQHFARDPRNSAERHPIAPRYCAAQRGSWTPVQVSDILRRDGRALLFPKAILKQSFEADALMREAIRIKRERRRAKQR